MVEISKVGFSFFDEYVFFDKDKCLFYKKFPNTFKHDFYCFELYI